MKENDFPRYLTRFLSQYLPGQKNVSPNTIASYRDTFKLFLIYCETCRGLAPERLTMVRLTKELVLGFLDWIETERHCSIPTRNHRLAVIHSFCRFSQKEFPENLYETQKILGISNKKSEKPLVSYLTGDEMRIILSKPDSSTKDGFRDLVLLSVLYDTDARVDEIVNLKEKDDSFLSFFFFLFLFLFMFNNYNRILLLLFVFQSHRIYFFTAKACTCSSPVST